jgi:hypothetical protein
MLAKFERLQLSMDKREEGTAVFSVRKDGKRFMFDMDRLLPKEEPTIPLKGQSYRLPFDGEEGQD